MRKIMSNNYFQNFLVIVCVSKMVSTREKGVSKLVIGKENWVLKVLMDDKQKEVSYMVVGKKGVLKDGCIYLFP